LENEDATYSSVDCSGWLELCRPCHIQRLGGDRVQRHDCWHTHSVYQYPTSAHIVVHEDNWRWGDHDHFRWREHEGRGFWHGDSWEDF
jgi:hypothetical protein